MKRLTKLKSRFFTRFAEALTGRSSSPRSLTRDRLLGFVNMVMATRDDEISCAECGEQLSRFAELTLAGKSANEAIPLVKDHLDRCAECREEFEALLEVLRESD